MLKDLLLTELCIPSADRIIAFDSDCLWAVSGAQDTVAKLGYTLLKIGSTEELRYRYEKDYRGKNARIVVLASKAIPIPFDIQEQFTLANLSLERLFPCLAASVLRKQTNIDWDFLSVASSIPPQQNQNEVETAAFCRGKMYTQAAVDLFATQAMQQLKVLIKMCYSYRDWYAVSALFAKIHLLKDMGFSIVAFEATSKCVEQAFTDWRIAKYKSLSATADVTQPVMLHNIPDYIRRNSKKAAFILIDGMSMEDYQIMRQQFSAAQFTMTATGTFSLLPSVTSIARQCAFSGKLPLQHKKPFDLSNEEAQWREYWTANGYYDADIYFEKSENPDIPRQAKIVGIVINAIDDLMHSQLQGDAGMQHDVRAWLKTGILEQLITTLMHREYRVYISADHGHTAGIGQGRFKKQGLLTEQASRRTVIYKDFADAESLSSFSVEKYAGTYMPSDYQYFLFAPNACFGDVGKEYISHGGATIEELLVPFITIGEINHG